MPFSPKMPGFRIAEHIYAVYTVYPTELAVPEQMTPESAAIHKYDESYPLSYSTNQRVFEPTMTLKIVDQCHLRQSRGHCDLRVFMREALKTLRVHC
jgi:hypothetical protein